MYSGVNASDGIGIGVASVAIEPDLTYTPHKVEDTEAEAARYTAAREAFMDMTNKQIANMQAKGLEKEAGILNAHIEFAEDDGIIDSVTMAVAEGMCAEQAVDNAYTMYYDMFSAMEDELSAPACSPLFWARSSWTSPRFPRTPSSSWASSRLP